MNVTVTVPIVGYVTFDVEVDAEEEAADAALDEWEEHLDDAVLEGVETVKLSQLTFREVTVVSRPEIEEEEGDDGDA